MFNKNKIDFKNLKGVKDLTNLKEKYKKIYHTKICFLNVLYSFLSTITYSFVSYFLLEIIFHHIFEIKGDIQFEFQVATICSIVIFVFKILISKILKTNEYDIDKKVDIIINNYIGHNCYYKYLENIYNDINTLNTLNNDKHLKLIHSLEFSKNENVKLLNEDLSNWEKELDKILEERENKKINNIYNKYNMFYNKNNIENNKNLIKK